MKRIIILITIISNCSFITIAQKPNYDVYALKFAEVRNPFPLSALVQGAPKKDSIHAIFMVWLIKGNNGRNILVDAGFLRGIEEANDFVIANYVRPDSILSELGLFAKDITDIILTHPHWDHMDGVDLFPNAQVWIQKEDYNYFVGNAWTKGGENGGFNKRDVRKLIDINLAGRLNLVDGDDKEIIPGVKVYTGSRHTFNSQYVLVESGARKIILASDNAYTYYNIEHLKSAPATFDTSGYIKSMARMKTLASNPKYIIPGHDGLVFSRFPTIAKAVAKIE